MEVQNPRHAQPGLARSLAHTAAVTLDSSETPPPLCYSPNSSDRGRASTADTTPISTPKVSTHTTFARKRDDLSLSWQRNPFARGHPSEPLSDSDLLFEDSDDATFPLFEKRSPNTSAPNMVQPAEPIDITPPRFNSASPQNQTSTLTSALQQARESQNRDFSSTPNNQGASGADFAERPTLGGRNGSISHGGGSFYGNGSRPIQFDKKRRESYNMGGSFAGGMSFGGVSVGSWIRDDILMSGTSPAQFPNSPSFHSSSYLPKMEAAFMRDFTCCGLTLASLHDLLQHFEEVHANAPAPRASHSNQGGLGGLPPTSSASAAGIAAGQTQTLGEPALHTQYGFNPRPTSTSGYRPQRLGSFSRTNLSTVQDMDSLDNMDMDDVGPAMDGLAPIDETSHFSSQTQSQYNNNQGPLQPLNVNISNGMQQHQGLRTSTPTTPSASQQFGLQHNPTVSSVNTPTLGTAPSLTSPESSHPGTPAELDMDFTSGFSQPMTGMQGMDMGYNGMNSMNGMNFGNGMAGFDGTIDQPGKRLFSKHGGGVTQQQLQAAYNNFQKMSATDQSDLAKRIREQQIMNGANIPQLPFPEEVKPFRCPVIGCEKAYKNQNGLKYHKQHGHQNQQLKENEDGTFSIVDPLTSIPYPGTVGMEKEKPYRCDTCGKRYKNLNGLKYHRAHAPNCNPELKLAQLASLQSLSGLNVNVAGAGMSGMDTQMF
ncbi:hypothetical protein M011DRAFT_491836 [Sporormia fimetaria CBS 119925]|uniref:C2H2-type domain-containing protein n=1 Tax=Sporormia fimetaria CBS 119925 TaxID=1340428 RepID=A0A6A6VP28_9PLEO|nr:hypothetical protein M011DRAFT_491836 [Sporormia fimetaria CBS 119925]